MYDKFYFEEGWIFSPFIKLKFHNMHFHNGLLILVFLCDMSGRVNLVGHGWTFTVDYVMERPFFAYFTLYSKDLSRIIHIRRNFIVFSLGHFLWDHSKLTWREEYLEQSKSIKKSWTGTESFDISFRVIFDHYCQSFIAGRETGY